MKQRRVIKISIVMAMITWRTHCAPTNSIMKQGRVGGKCGLENNNIAIQEPPLGCCGIFTKSLGLKEKGSGRA